MIQVFDPIVHQPVDEPSTTEVSFDRSVVADLRWVRCRRPVVLSGGELRLSMLDLDFDESTRFYQAPPQLKANNGVCMIDDLGRQRVQPVDLLNRWIVPMEERRDFLALGSGEHFPIPFEVVLIFSTNLDPLELADEAFLRRLGHKIRFAPMAEVDYRSVFRNVCAEYGIPFDEPMFERLLRDYHATSGKPLLACYPRDLLRAGARLRLVRRNPAAADGRGAEPRMARLLHRGMSRRSCAHPAPGRT